MSIDTEKKAAKNPKSTERAIAVLPFANMSGDEEFEYFSDGITEEIINALARLESVKVTSRTSSFFYKNANKSIRQIAEEISVPVILEGSVRMAKDTVRITAQLIEAENDFHFWSETWDRKLDNIFEIQDEISLHIADRLREHFGHFEIDDHLVKQKTSSIEAYNYSLKARYHYNRWNLEDVNIAIVLFNKAINLDPGHVDAYIGLADAYGYLASSELMPPLEAWQKVREYTNRANQLDDSHAGVLYQLANLAFFTEADFQAALNYAKKSLEINPNHIDSLQFISFLYAISGQFDKAERCIKTALKIDPLSKETLFFKAYFLYRTEKYTEALTALEECLEANPKNSPAHVVKSYCLLKLGENGEAIQYISELASGVIAEDELRGLKSIASLYNGNTSVEKNILFKELVAEAQKPYSFIAHSYLYLSYTILGRETEAFELLDRIIQLKSPIIFLSFADPLANAIKGESRYSDYHRELFRISNDLPGQNQVKSSLLDPETASRYTEILLQFIEEEEPYLIPNLSLRSLAEQVQIHPNKLSWLLNERIGKNFNEFINQYRIEYFKVLAKDPGNSHISLLGLAFESGFNSKTVFNTYFKKETGMTPKEFLKQLDQ